MFTDVLDLKIPAKLEVFIAVLAGSGYTILGKDDWRDLGDLHPFLLPIAKRGEGDDVEVIGLCIRGASGGELPPDSFMVVTQKPRSQEPETCWKMKLVAFDIEKYVAKRAEEATFESSEKDKAVIEAVKDVYDVKFSGADRNALNKWLLLQVGAFPDVYRQLAQEHIDAGDPKSALVIADTMRDAFSQFAFSHSYVAKVLRVHFNGKAVGDDINRELEAEHSAVRCFKTASPLWTLHEEDNLQDLLLEAKMPKVGSVNDLRVFYLGRVVDDQRASVRTGEISVGCATLAKAQALLDARCCGHKTYKGIRQELRDFYDEVPRCEPLVDMISYYMD